MFTHITPFVLKNFSFSLVLTSIKIPFFIYVTGVTEKGTFIAVLQDMPISLCLMNHLLPAQTILIEKQELWQNCNFAFRQFFMCNLHLCNLIVNVEKHIVQSITPPSLLISSFLFVIVIRALFNTFYQILHR